MLLPLVTFGSLVWKNSVIDYHAKPADESVTALYYFVNEGAAPVQILTTKTSCGCTVATLEKEVYAPGEMGVLKAKFTFEGRTGVQKKNILVYTNDPKVPEVMLTLNVDIPPFISVEPQLLFWTRGEKPLAKSAIVMVLAKDPVLITKVESSDPTFDCQLTTIEEGRRYSVSVTPKITNGTGAEAKVTLTTNVGKENPRKAFLMVQVY